MNISLQEVKHHLNSAIGAYVEGQGFVRAEVNPDRSSDAFLCLVNEKGFFLCFSEGHNPNGAPVVDDHTFMLTTDQGSKVKITPLFPVFLR